MITRTRDHDPLEPSEGTSTASRPDGRRHGLASAIVTLGRALRPTRYWQALPPHGLVALLVATAVALHLTAAAARVAGMLATPVPAASMGPVHRAAEIALAVAAPASRFSGAELWNVSRNAGRSEERGGDAVVAFLAGAARLTFAPWTGSVVIEPHDAATWRAQRVELTPSLPPLASGAGWILVLLGGPACALVVASTRRLIGLFRREPSSSLGLTRVTTWSAPVAVGLGAIVFSAGAWRAVGIAAPDTVDLVARIGVACVLVAWMRGVDSALRASTLRTSSLRTSAATAPPRAPREGASEARRRRSS